MNEKKIVRLYSVYLSFNDEVEAKNPREAIAKVRKNVNLNGLLAETDLLFRIGDTTYSGFTITSLKKELAREASEKLEAGKSR
jgi:Tat protein secretion system quality control protein TatD with DNase activity